LTKASLYVYFGPVAVLTCGRFDHTHTDIDTIQRVKKAIVVRESSNIVHGSTSVAHPRCVVLSFDVIYPITRNERGAMRMLAHPEIDLPDSARSSLSGIVYAELSWSGRG